jgi:hypothetical protein
MRAGLAKEEYATTWQEENEGKPQAKRVPQPQDQRGAEDEGHGTFACRCLTKDQRAAKRPAKRTAKRTAKPAARRRIPAQTAPSAPTFGGGMAGGEPDEIVILSTEELIDETDIDLGGDEGGDDDLEGM